MSEADPPKDPANDAHLIQLVRGRLGRDDALSGDPKLNVSSCGMVVSLHGFVRNPELRDRAGEIASSVYGVEGVINKLRIP